MNYPVWEPIVTNGNIRRRALADLPKSPSKNLSYTHDLSNWSWFAWGDRSFLTSSQSRGRL